MLYKRDGVRERRPVHCLSANPTTIYRACLELRAAMDMKQFRMIHLQMYPQYKKGRLLTDMCDHCTCYEKKIRPRVQQFIGRMWRELLHLCPLYWRAMVARPGSATFFRNRDYDFVLNTYRKYLWSEQERADQDARAGASNRLTLRHKEGELHKDFCGAFSRLLTQT